MQCGARTQSQDQEPDKRPNDDNFKWIIFWLKKQNKTKNSVIKVKKPKFEYVLWHLLLLNSLYLSFLSSTYKSFSKLLLDIYYVPDTVLGTGNK